MNHIELFAGCGGLSLGLETAGFNLLVANELSPMASETFAHNHLAADLVAQKNVDKVYWVSSSHPRSRLKLRLRENPYEATGLSENQHSDLLDLKPDNHQLQRSLLVGSIVDINNILDPTTEIGKRNPWLSHQLKSGLGSGSVDLVSGGPPCQSFSLAGMRDHSHHRNQLPGEFARFVGIVRPRIAILENVSGILRAFNVDGKKHYAWFETAKAFALEGYVPLCLHVNAKYVGTAQNRPRFIMLALRKDIYDNFKKKLKSGDPLLGAIEESEALLHQVKKGDPAYGSLKYFDIDKDDSLFRNSILAPLVSHKDPQFPKKNLVSVKEAIDDLHKEGRPESSYVKCINQAYTKQLSRPLNKLKNHEPRNNNNRVRARFRMYQVMTKIPKGESKEISNYLKNEGSTEISRNALASISKHWLLNLTGSKILKPTKSQTIEILDGLYTKKQTQRALLADEPAPAALSIPDDACHYYESESTQRTLTVREMTRIQSFPDWYEIKSKVTTGGQMRKFEVPQYTQIGNAVPPLLGIALGEVCKTILDLAASSRES